MWSKPGARNRTPGTTPSAIATEHAKWRNIKLACSKSLGPCFRFESWSVPYEFG